MRDGGGGSSEGWWCTSPGGKSVIEYHVTSPSFFASVSQPKRGSESKVSEGERVPPPSILQFPFRVHW